MKIIERRVITFFFRQLEIMPKDDFSAAFLAGELMAWGLAKTISNDTEQKLGRHLAQWKIGEILNEAVSG